MQLTETDIRARLAADFGGSLLFQPIRVSDDAARPVTQLASVAQLLPRAAVLRAAVQDTPATHRLQDLLHHQPQPRQR